MISIWPVSAIIITAITSRIITKSWLTPGSFFSLLWSFFMFAPLIFAPDFLINSLGLWFVAIATMACSAGSFFAFSPVPNLNEKKLYNNKIFEQFIKGINLEKYISRQSLPTLYCTSGAIYARTYKLLKSFSGKDFCLGKKPIGIVIDDIEAINIDRKIDFDFANFISKNYSF